MKPSTRCVVVGLLLAQMAAVGPVSGQPKSDERASPESQRAHEHFSLGVKLYAEGEFGPALAQFQRAYAARPHYRVLYNIAQCNFELREYVGARGALRGYLAEGGAAVLDVEQRARVEADIAELGRRIAEIDVRSNVRGAVVYIDGRRIGTTPLAKPVEVSEGPRSLSVESSALGAKQRSLLLVGGERQAITVNFELVATPPSAPPLLERSPREPRPPSSAPGLGAGFWIAGVGALLLAGGGGATGYLALRAQDERRADLRRPNNEPELDSDRRRIQTLALATDTLLGGALVCAGVATALFVMHGPGNRSALAVAPGSISLRTSF